ncbi:MAG: nicotinamide riboside transporter PnuC [Quisquiliibacterium sp.]
MLESAFELLGSQVTWLELLAFIGALGCVILSVLEIHWGWLLAIVSSILYGFLFAASRLYGEAALQVFFVVVAAWGWWQWLFGRRSGQERIASGQGLRVAWLSPAGRRGSVAAWLGGWLLLGMALKRYTDSDVPWFDAFPTAGSLVGQLLLARKFIENWVIWTIVNLASVVLFAYKELWLTALLYLLFAGLAVVGWQRWRRQAASLALAARDGC